MRNLIPPSLFLRSTLDFGSVRYTTSFYQKHTANSNGEHSFFLPNNYSGKGMESSTGDIQGYATYSRIDWQSFWRQMRTIDGQIVT